MTRDRILWIRVQTEKNWSCASTRQSAQFNPYSNGLGGRDSIHGMRSDFSLFHSVQADFEFDSASHIIPGVKGPWHEADHSHPTAKSGTVGCTFRLQFIFISWCLTKQAQRQVRLFSLHLEDSKQALVLTVHLCHAKMLYWKLYVTCMYNIAYCVCIRQRWT
jgi:hypothetical protein